MRRARPGALQDLGGARGVAARGKQPSRNRRRRHEVGREAVRLEREGQRAVGIGLLGGLRLRRQQHGAAAIGLGALDVTVLARDRQRLQRAGPVRLAALQVEQRVDRPARASG